jgi:RimJ/RimL family protein N-acetyltransferase
MCHDDLDLFAEFLGDPECVRYLIVPRPHTRAESAVLLDRWVAQHEGGIGMFTVLDADETVGWAGYVHRSLHWGDEMELGWSIRKQHWGNGYATAAAQSLRALGPERVVHLIHPENAASIAVARKLGAIHERDTEIRGGPIGVWVSSRAAADPG